MPDDAENKEKPRNTLAQGLKYVHIGFILPASVIVGLLFGSLLDRWLGTKWLTLAGLALGVVAGFYDLIRTVMKMSKEQ